MWAAVAAAILVAPPPDPGPAPPSRIVFASTRTTVSQLYSAEPSGERVAQLTFGTGSWGRPIPSPDGRYVAAYRGENLWLMRADGSGARSIAPNVWGSVSWSGDSRRLVYGTTNGEIWSAAAAGAPPRQITHGQSSGYDDRLPSASPDGRSIAFVRTARGVPMLIVRRRGRERTLLKDVGGAPSWSPDGRWIAIGGDSLALVRPTGGRRRVLVADRTCGGCLYGAVWSPDARRLAYVDRNGAGIDVVRISGGSPRLLRTGDLTYGLAWSPAGDAIAFVTAAGIGTVTLGGKRQTIVAFGPYDLQPGVGWSPDDAGSSYQPPEEIPALVRVSPRELQARYPIQHFAADGDRITYWLCPHALGAWRPGDAQAIPLGLKTYTECRLQPESSGFGNYVFDLALAGDRLAYLTAVAANRVHTALMLATLGSGTEGGEIVEYAHEYGTPPALADVLGGGSTLVYGARELLPNYRQGPEAVWRVDGAKPVAVASSYEDLQPLAVDQGRIVVRRGDDGIDVLDLDGHVLQTFEVQAIAAALDADELVVLVQGELREYSASTGQLLQVWPLPDVPSSGRCHPVCNGIRLTFDDAARGLAVYTLDGAVHLLRLRDGADVTVPGATAAELTDTGLFYTYTGDEPWPGRIRFVPFPELPL
jgi:WD40 repeat protein